MKRTITALTLLLNTAIKGSVLCKTALKTVSAAKQVFATLHEKSVQIAIKKMKDLVTQILHAIPTPTSALSISVLLETIVVAMELTNTVTNLTRVALNHVY
jgi:hypothetical protein